VKPIQLTIEQQNLLLRALEELAGELNNDSGGTDPDIERCSELWETLWELDDSWKLLDPKRANTESDTLNVARRAAQHPKRRMQMAASYPELGLSLEERKVKRERRRKTANSIGQHFAPHYPCPKCGGTLKACGGSFDPGHRTRILVMCVDGCGLPTQALTVERDGDPVVFNATSPGAWTSK